jgi:predicted anti-sigma-YlaC factor YlaD
MDCDEARQAISALLDGEVPGVELEELDNHLAICEACRSWQEQAHWLTRRVRLQPLSAPGPSPQLLEAVARQRQATRGHLAPMTLVRAGLAAVALTQLALAVSPLLFGQDHSAPVHVAHEMGAFEVAVSIGFLVAVRRPARAMGMVALMGAAAALLVVTALIDLALDHTSLTDEAPHLLVVAGWLLLRRLAVLAPPSFDRPQHLRAGLGGLWPARSEERRARGWTSGAGQRPETVMSEPSRTTEGQRTVAG